jgi:uncharacterized membrane protein required for colicin V production
MMPCGGRITGCLLGLVAAFLALAAFVAFLVGLGPVKEMKLVEDDDAVVESEEPDARRSKLDLVRVVLKWN